MTTVSSLPPDAGGRRESGGDDGVELFRRAVWGGDEAACARLIVRYRRLVLTWMSRLPAAHAVKADDNDRVVRTFERFWLAMKDERCERFGSVAALLGYLKLCAASVVQDDVRHGRGGHLRTLSLDAVAEATGGRSALLGGESDTEAQAMARAGLGELWAIVEQVLLSEAERRVFYLRFAIGLSPREIHGRHPDHYPTVADVYRVKRNALLRLRRCKRLQRLWHLTSG